MSKQSGTSGREAAYLPSSSAAAIRRRADETPIDSTCRDLRCIHVLARFCHANRSSGSARRDRIRRRARTLWPSLWLVPWSRPSLRLVPWSRPSLWLVAGPTSRMELSAGAFPTNVKHPDEVKEESPKGEARKIIEEYVKSLRELIKDMHRRFS